MEDTLIKTTEERARVRNILSEIKTFEEEGLIHDPSGKINLEKLVEDSRIYLDRLSQAFGEIKEDLSGRILSLTNTAYITFFDTSFLGEKPGRSTKYNPNSFLESAHRLSFEMSNSGMVKGFYEALASNFSQSTKFVYNLVVKDLCRVLDEVKERSDYSKEAFTGFALDVLAQALPYSQGHVVDKWDIFRGQFDAIKNKYFSSENQDQAAKPNLAAVNMTYISGLMKEGTLEFGVNGKTIEKTPGQRFCEALHVCGIDFGGRRDSSVARIAIYTGESKAPERVYLELEKGQKVPVKDFFADLGDAALSYLKQKNYSGPLEGMTHRAMINIREHL